MSGGVYSPTAPGRFVELIVSNRVRDGRGDQGQAVRPFLPPSSRAAGSGCRRCSESSAGRGRVLRGQPAGRGDAVHRTAPGAGPVRPALDAAYRGHVLHHGHSPEHPGRSPSDEARGAGPGTDAVHRAVRDPPTAHRRPESPGRCDRGGRRADRPSGRRTDPEQLGFEVLTATNGQEAMGLFDGPRGPGCGWCCST